MRIATITNWAYGITVGLTLASGSAMLMASSADRVERQAVQQRQVFDTLSDEVENDAWALSDLARLYVVKPSPETLTQYQQLQQTDKSIEQRLAGLKDNGASREELALLQDGLQIAAELQNEQQAALAACRPRRCASGHRRAVRQCIRDRAGTYADADRSLPPDARKSRRRRH